MNTLVALLWLRWRSVVNATRGDLFNFSKVGGYFIIGVAVFLFSSIGVLTGLALRATVHDGFAASVQMVNNFTGIFLAFVVVMKLLSSGKLLRGFSLTRYRLYPIPMPLLHILNFFLGMIDVWYIFLFGYLITFAVSAGVFAFSAGTTLMAISLITLNIFFVHLVFESLRTLGRLFVSASRTYKYLTLGLILAVAILFMGQQGMAFDDALVPSLGTIIRFLPLGWMNEAFVSIIMAFPTSLLDKTLFTTFLVNGVACLLLVMITILEMRISTVPVLSVQRKKKLSPPPLESFFFFLPTDIIPHLAKDLRYLIRSRRTRVIFLMIPLLVIIFIIVFLQTSKFATTVAKPFFFIPFLSFIPLLWEQYYVNYFGMEKSAFLRYLFSPTTPTRILVAKNISLFLAVFPFVALGWIYVGIYWPFSVLALLVLSQVAVLGIAFISGNFISLVTPIPVEAREFRGVADTNSSSLYGFIHMICGFAALLVIGFSTWYFGISFATYSIVGILAIIVYVIYVRTLPTASKLFITNAELIHSTLNRS